MNKKIILGTRGSLLALAQTKMVIQQIATFFPSLNIEIKIIKTLGDRLKNQPLKDIGGKTVFTREIEESLLKGEIDIAVHSMKDLEVPLPQGLSIGSILKREDPRDVLISFSGQTLGNLPAGSKIGTCSPRRIAQILSYRPDLKTVMMRGNVDTRLKKLSEGECDAIILAYAGLKRLNLVRSITEILAPEVMIPAAGQGSIGVQIRQDDTDLKKILHFINDKETENVTRIEHQLLNGFGGNCDTPIAGWAHYFPDQSSGIIKLNTMVATLDGRNFIKKVIIEKEEILFEKAFSLGQELKRWYDLQLKS